MSTELDDMEQGRTVRVTRPGSYMFGIKSFSSITELDMETSNFKCFGSPEFESCGHKWKLLVYPYGDEKHGVADHVSLYLVSTDADIETEGYEINAKFTMFIYDHLRDNFLTIQDGEVRRFHKLKKQWGFGRLISLGSFKETNNGYLENDCCVFGVEISVIPTSVKVGYISLIEKPEDAKFTWTLNKFSTLGDDSSSSDIFEIQGHKWYLVIYPNGYSTAKGTNPALFLHLHVSLCAKPAVYAKYVLRVRNHLNDEHHDEHTFVFCFDSLGGWGVPGFILLDDLKNQSNGFIVDDSVTFEVEFLWISQTDS